MRKFTVDWTLNVYGADELDLLYGGLWWIYSDLNLTRENSKIIFIQPYGDPSSPQTAVVRIQRGDDPLDTYDILYDRRNINDILKQPVLNAADITAVKSVTSSVELLDYIAKKYNCGFTPDDFWVSINSIEYTGGQVTPNWLMESRYNSIGWYGELIVQIHPPA